jgi:hypothetical protein
VADTVVNMPAVLLNDTLPGVDKSWREVFLMGNFAQSNSFASFHCCNLQTDFPLMFFSYSICRMISMACVYTHKYIKRVVMCQSPS